MMRFALALIIVVCTQVSQSLASDSQTTTSGTVYLTFDDGPIDATLGVLDVLQETKTKATFFVNGFHLAGEGDENEDRSLEALRRIVEEGHTLANHGVNHMLHNCCDESGTCGAQVCNIIQEWNIQSYQEVEKDASIFHANTKFIARPEFLGAAETPPTLPQFARLPYTNAWRLPSNAATTTYLSIDCPCCTSDDLAPWDPAFTCSLEAPTQSATLASLVADRLLETEGFDAIFGWDLEWGPENWGDQDPASTLTSAHDLFLQVDDLLHNSAAVTARTQDKTLARSIPGTNSYCTEENLSSCEEMNRLRAGKVVVLTHEFLFEDGRRGKGATNNLPKLKEFIELLQTDGYLLDTIDNYLESTSQVAASEDEILEEEEVYSSGRLSQCFWLLPNVFLLVFVLTNQ